MTKIGKSLNNPEAFTMLNSRAIPGRLSSAQKLNAYKPSSSMITYSSLGDNISKSTSEAAYRTAYENQCVLGLEVKQTKISY